MRLRVFNEADFDALHALDLTALRHDDPNFDALPDRERDGRIRTSLPALRFFERSEHSFVAEHLGELVGAVLAQHVWQGDRPVVLVSRVLLHPDAPEGTAAALLRVCSKSAYDTAVYEVHLPATPDLHTAAHEEGFRAVATYAVRHLGTRAETAPGETIGG